MDALTALFRAVLCDDAGQGLVEYALVIAMVSITCIAALRYFGTTEGNAYGSITNSILQAE